MKNSLYGKWIKRMLDLVLSALALLILSPLVLLTALLVRIKLGSPVIFKQARPGLHEKVFYLLKFRSMTNATGEDGRLLPDAERLTRFGKFLRSSSLDELPELLNIFRGDMSIVGPRPLLLQYVPLYNERQRLRLNVKPGITGYAQINGRNAISWPEKFELDAWYVEHRTFWLDIKIILTTVKKILTHEGISAPGEATMPPFRGENDTETSRP